MAPGSRHGSDYPRHRPPRGSLLAVGDPWGIALVGWLLWAGPTGPRVVAAMVAFGLALGAGLTGVVCRKRAASTLLPSEANRSVGFRGGQGGL